MLAFWIILGCLVVALLTVAEIRSERKPAKLRSGTSADESIKWPTWGGGD
jgi:hypothetical protein